MKYIIHTMKCLRLACVSPILVIKMAALFVRLVSYTVNFMGGWELNNLEGNQIRLGCTSPLLLGGASITYASTRPNLNQILSMSVIQQGKKSWLLG